MPVKECAIENKKAAPILWDIKLLLEKHKISIGMANQISGMEAFKVDNIGNIIVTVVLCATLVYELVGPLITKWSLSKAHEIPSEENE